MRKVTIIFIIILTITSDIMAQSWNFGIEAGYVNTTWQFNIVVGVTSSMIISMWV